MIWIVSLPVDGEEGDGEEHREREREAREGAGSLKGRREGKEVNFCIS